VAKFADYMARRAAETTPPTLASSEVAEVFFGDLSAQNLQYLDEQGYLRPSYYLAGQQLVDREARDAALDPKNRTHGDARRRYSYEDLVWIRLLIYLRDGLKSARATRPLQRAGAIVRRLRGTEAGCPQSARLLFFGADVYLLEGDAVISLTDGQIALRQVVTDHVEAEVRGRIDALVAIQRIRPIQAKCSMKSATRLTA
jgi:DNA-binding transcriptional MerR regulator